MIRVGRTNGRLRHLRPGRCDGQAARGAFAGRLGRILYEFKTPSESADVVTARAAAFHELKALIDKHRLAAESD